MKRERVTSALDPRLLPYRGVRDPVWLRQRGLFLAEGREAAVRLLRATHLTTRSLLVTEASVAALESELRGSDLPVYIASHEVMQGVSGVRFHQGCIALGSAPPPISATDAVAGLAESARRVLVLEAVTNPDNVGALFRNARAFGVAAIFLDARCASPLYRKAIRTSTGASLEIPFTHGDCADRVLELLGARGFTRIALSPRARAESLHALETGGFLRRCLALAVGNEGAGLSNEVEAACEHTVRVDMVPGVDSLNVATAAAVVLQRIFALAGSTSVCSLASHRSNR